MVKLTEVRMSHAHKRDSFRRKFEAVKAMRVIAMS